MDILLQYTRSNIDMKQDIDINDDNDINMDDKQNDDNDVNMHDYINNLKTAKMKVLNEKQKHIVMQTLAKSTNTVVAKHSRCNLTVTVKDLCTLQGNNWLNDEIINYHIALLQDRNLKRIQSNYNESNHGKVIFMNTFFLLNYQAIFLIMM
eukprot:554320_1